MEKIQYNYDIKSNIVGYAKGLEKEARILNRTLRFTHEAVKYEPDRRHADLIVQEFFPQGAKPATTPGTDVVNVDRDSEELLNKQDARKYRGLAARLNFLAMDRTDLQYAAKTVAKCMANPRTSDWLLIKRIAKYLFGSTEMHSKN